MSIELASQTYAAKRITIKGPISIAAFINNLHAEIGFATWKPGEITSTVKAILTQPANEGEDAAARKERVKADFVAFATHRIGPSGFIMFDTTAFDAWFSLFTAKPVPRTVRYTVGNPLVTVHLLEHELNAALSVPFQLLISGDDKETKIVYDLPSSAIALEVDGAVENKVLLEVAHKVDEKLEEFLRRAILKGDQS